MTVQDLEAAFVIGTPDHAGEWLSGARGRVARDRGELETLFPAAARACGRTMLPGGWRADDAARVLVLASLSWPDAVWLRRLYDHGDADERRAVLLALDYVDLAGDAALPLVEDAVRTNDTRLITAALGRYAASHLSAAAFRQAVLKCVFCGIPLSAVAGLDERADAELARMLSDFARERVVAGRTISDDVWPIVARFPPPVPSPRSS